MSHPHRRRTSRASAYWLKIALVLFAILAIIIYFALSALLNKLPKIEYSILSLTPTPSSGIYEPPLTSYVIAQEALLHPNIDPQSEVIARLIKDTPVLLLEFKEEWVKVQASTTDPISGWGLRIAFAMNEPKPAPAATDSIPTYTPSPTVVVTLAMTPPLTATQALTLPIAGTPTLAPTAQVTATVSITIPAPLTLIPPLELSPTPPILADAVVQASTLKLRSAPDERSADAGEVQQYAILKVIDKTQDCRWLYVVTDDGTQGWVPIGAVTLNMNCIQIPVAPLSSTPNAPAGQTPQPNPQGADASHSGAGTSQNSSSQSSTSSSDTSPATQSEAKSDLVVTAFTIRNIAENTITFDYTIANQGAIPVAMTTQSQPLGIAIHVFLSDSQGNELSQGQTLYPPALKGLAPGQAFSYAYPGTFASATRFNPTGTLHLTLVVDAENVVSEVNENNNQWISMPLPITPTPTPQPTGTPIPTATLTSTLLATNTPLATAMPTYIPTFTPTLLTVDTPKWTATATNIPFPTNTSVLTLVPTFTTASISTLTSTPTNVPTYTPTAMTIDPPTATPTKTRIPFPTVIPSVAPILLNPDFECTEGYYSQTNNIGEEILIPNHWLLTILNGAPRISSARIFFAQSCDGSAHVEKINLTDSIVVRAQDLETPPEPGKPFDVAFYQPVAVTIGGTYSLSGWLLSLCGGSAVPSDCSTEYYIAKMLGIDPTGGTNPNAESVIWAENRHNFVEDGKRVGWQQIGVSAIAEASTITIFARIKSPFRWHGNHAFIDALSLVRAPVVRLNVPAIINGTTINLQWEAMQSVDVAAIFGGTHQLLIDIQYRRQTDEDWTNIQSGFVGAGSAIINVPCTGITYEFRIRARAEQPAASAGAWPNHRYLGIWDAPVLVKVLGDQISCP